MIQPSRALAALAEDLSSVPAPRSGDSHIPVTPPPGGLAPSDIRGHLHLNAYTQRDENNKSNFFSV